jgi:hypothetical protein
VQKPPGDAAVRFIQQAVSQIRRPKQHTSTSDPQQTFANQGNQESRYELLREDHCTPELL